MRLDSGKGSQAGRRRGSCWIGAALHCLGFLFACTATTILLGTNALADAEQAAQVPNYLHHQAWSTEEGLPQASVHAILQSREGYLWIATEDGVARFDGQNFRILNHATVPQFASNDVSCLAEDKAGDIWFGTSDGLVRKHGEEYRRFSKQNGLPSDEIVAVAASPNDLLVLTASGLAVWQLDHFERIASNEVITSLTGSDQGSILVAKNGGVYSWNHGQLVGVAQPTEDGAAVLGAAIGDKQASWTFGSNFVQYTSPSQKRVWRIGVDLPGTRVQALYVDQQGRAWIGTNRGLVSVEAARGFRLGESEALRGESVLSVFLDRDGDLWAGTEASGLHVLQPRKFANVPGSNSEAVTAVTNSRGVMYFGTRDDGIFRSEPVPVPIAANQLTSPVILSLAAGANGDLWAGTPDGLNHIVGAEVHHWTIGDGLPDNFVRSVIVAADRTVWAGTRFGLVHIEGNAVRTFAGADGLPSESIGPLLEVSSKQTGNTILWIGTSAGLCQQANQSIRCLSSPFAKNDSIVTALGADRGGGVWVALHGHGLGMVKDDRIVRAPAAGVPTEIVGILADDLGYLWLRSTRGLYRAKVGDLQACVTDTSACSGLAVDTFGRGDGMQSDEIAGEGIPSLAEGPNGELWFATRRGVAITDPQHLFTNRVPPGVVITQALADGVELSTGEDAEVSPGHRQYSFEYAGLSLNNAGATRCRYVLDGFDRGWIDAGTRRTAYYTNLPPRQYAFRVACANGDGLWSRQEAAFRFRVLRPWYRTPWAYLLGVCTVALGVFGLFQLRIRAERRRFGVVLQERTRVAREVHDTLAQDLVSLSLQVEMAAQHAKAGRLADVTNQLVQTRSLVRQALESARQSIWNLRANVSNESLPARLTTRVDSLRGTKISARLRITGEYRSAPVSMENEVMRIATEAISNVERHSGATEMAVDLSYSADSLQLQVRDNGRGFDYESSRGMADHYGLQGLEERAALLRARLEIESVAGQGTMVTLVAPLPTER